MAKLYATLIQKELLTIEQVPEAKRAEVLAELAARGWEA